MLCHASISTIFRLLLVAAGLQNTCTPSIYVIEYLDGYKKKLSVFNHTFTLFWALDTSSFSQISMLHTYFKIVTNSYEYYCESTGEMLFYHFCVVCKYIFIVIVRDFCNK
jgi:hypothetical protein